MKFLRVILTCLVLTLVLAVLAVALAFVPAVQTWVAQAELDRRPELQLSLDRLAVGWDDVEITNLRVVRGGAVLTLPSLEAKLPVKTALWDRKVLVRNLVAKGWTLDLSQPAQTGEEPASAASGATGKVDMGEQVLDPAGAAAKVVQLAEQVANGVYAGWKFPGEGALDGLDLEGDVLIPGAAGMQPGRVHLVVKGGGFAAAREAKFTTAASAAVVGPGLQVTDVTAQGHLTVALDAARRMTEVETQTDVTARSRSAPNAVVWSLGASADRRQGADDYALQVRQGSRRLVNVAGRFMPATHALEGKWSVALENSDVAMFVPAAALPVVTLAGEGRFATDTEFKTVRAAGRLNVTASGLGAWMPRLGNVGQVKARVGFDLAQQAGTIRFERLEASLAGDQPVADLQWLQAFAVDETTGKISGADTKRDWLRISLTKLPLAWWGGWPAAATVTAGEASGEFLVATGEGGCRVRQTAPLQADGIALANKAGETLVRGLDLSLVLAGDYAAGGWSAQAESVKIDIAGRHVADIQARFSQTAGADQPAEFAGTGTVDLGALIAQAMFPGMAWVRGRSATGDFSGRLGAWPEVKGKLAVTGHDPAHRLTATVQADIGDDGSVSFLVPMRLILGAQTSDLNAEGSWGGPDDTQRVDVKLSGENVFLGHLRLLGAPAMAAVLGGRGGKVPSLAELTESPSTVRDRAPFWGSWVGSLSTNFRKLHAGDQEFDDVGGLLNFDGDAIRLIGGRVWLAQHNLVAIDGSLAFDPDANFPYTVKGAVNCKEFEAARLFPKPKEGEDLPVEGRFSFADSVTGTGANLSDLINRAREDIRITSNVGIVRLLKTDVAESLPVSEDLSAADSLKTVGSEVGSFFGVKKNSGGWGNVKVNQTTESVLGFVTEVAEIGYDQLSMIATREPRGGLRLTEIDLVAPEAHVTGSGEIATGMGRPLRDQPLKLDLNFAAKGAAAELLTKAGLLAKDKDALGYTRIDRQFHFGGTLEHFDASAWHDFLLKAALRNMPAGKKGG